MSAKVSSFDATRDSSATQEEDPKEENPKEKSSRENFHDYRNFVVNVLKIKEENKHFRFDSDQFWAYDEATGLWTPYDQAELKRQALAYCGGNVSDSRKLIKGLEIVYAKGFPDEHKHLIAVSNGMLDPVSGKVDDHDPKYNLRRRVEIAYDPEAKAPRWRQFLQEAFPESDPHGDIKRRFLKCWFGYHLLRELPHHHFVVLSGKGGDGKGTLLKVLSAMVGEHNTESDSRSFAGLTATTYKLAGCCDKLAYICPDFDPQVKIPAIVKTLSGGDRVDARQIYKEHVQFKPFFKITLAVNGFPKITDDIDAIKRRIRIIEFTRTFKADKVDPELFNKLHAELPGILAWAVRGLQFVVKNGRLPKLPCSEQFLEALLERDNPFYAFRKRLAHDRTGTQAIMLWQQFNEFCRNHGHKHTMNTTSFGLALKQAGIGSRKSGGCVYRHCKFVR